MNTETRTLFSPGILFCNFRSCFQIGKQKQLQQRPRQQQLLLQYIAPQLPPQLFHLLKGKIGEPTGQQISYRQT